MKQIILTEKPSVARDFAASLNAPSRGTHFENERYIICSAIGHLVTIVDPEDYNPAWKRWSLQSLPLIPEKTAFKVIPKTAKQFALVKKQLSRADVSSAIIATDAGREGEYIARLILHQAQFKKPLQRFWVSQALTPAVIAQGMRELQPASRYLGYFYSAGARAVGDWLVGMNGTRGLTKALGGDLLSVGRVQTPTLALIVDRQRERDEFTPEEFVRLRAHFAHRDGLYSGWYRSTTQPITRRFFVKEGGREKLDAIAAAIENQPGTIQSVQTREKRELPPRLFSLTSLQRRANVRFGFSASHTLSLAQELYERDKLLSYPRTDAEVMGEDNISVVRASIDALRPHCGELVAHITETRVTPRYKRNFNNAALTDHHALIPLGYKPGLSGDKAKLLQLVIERFIAAFCDDYIYRSTEILTEVKGHIFESRGHIPIQQGWKAVEVPPRKKSDEPPLPPVCERDPVSVRSTELTAEFTKAPPLYTEATLLAAMEHPRLQGEEDNDLQKIIKEAGLGTPATRASIIETLCSRAYILRQKKEIHPQPKGVALIESLRRLPHSAQLTNPVGTAQMEQILSEVAQQSAGPERFLDQVKEFTRTMVGEIQSLSPDQFPPELRHKSAGGYPLKGKKGGAKKGKKSAKKLSISCPLCHSPLVERRYKEKQSNQWQRFAGCSSYPRCRHTQPLP
jgi:DNA topoisomerase-3